MASARRYVALAVLATLFAGVSIPLIYAQSVQQNLLTSTLCGIIAGISEVVGLLAIFMFIVGGTLYAFAHFLPAAGNIKGAAQGWGMGILMGGIIMIILYALAPFIVNIVLQFSLSSASTGVNIGPAGSVTCSGAVPSVPSTPSFPTTTSI